MILLNKFIYLRACRRAVLRAVRRADRFTDFFADFLCDFTALRAADFLCAERLWDRFIDLCAAII